MDKIEITYNVTRDPDFSGFKYYVENGDPFDAADYAKAYKLNPYDFDMDSVKAAQDAAGHLNVGEWLEICHE